MKNTGFVTKIGPLTGINVLDFTWVLAGPACTKFLRDMGADVIKVERYKDGANERHQPYFVTKNGVSQSSYNINVNRGKKSMCVNLKTPEGKEIIRKLVQRSDIIVENYTPGVMTRMGFDYASVKKIRPDIIYCSISCFGQTGPYKDRPGYDIIAQSASGWTDREDPPIIAPCSIGDLNAAVHAVCAICAALYYREKKGIGQYLDIALMDCLFHLPENTIPWYFITKAVGNPIDIPKIGRTHPSYAPYGIYKAKDGFIAIAALSDNLWEKLVRSMGKKYEWLLTDSRTVSTKTRCNLENAPFINKIIDEWAGKLSARDAEKMLSDNGVPCIRVKTVQELVDEDAHIKAREMVVEVEQPFIGKIMMYGNPIKASETAVGPRGPGPFLGEHNDEVLREILNYDENRIKTLYEAEVLYAEPAVQKLKSMGEGKKITS